MVQIIIVCVYFVLTLLVGFLTKRAKSNKNFDGLNLGLVACVAIGTGEWVGGTSTTGVAEYGYTYGISGAWFTVANGIGLILVTIFFSKLFRRLNQSTISGVLSHYTGEKTRFYAGIVQLIIQVIIGTTQIIAIGTLAETLFGWPSWAHIPCMIVIGAGILLFSIFGGMKAIGKTNVLHLVFMYLGIITAVIFLLIKVGGFETLTKSSNLNESYFSLTTIGSTKITSWCLASILGSCISQASLQPILTAKDEKTSQRSCLVIALLVAPFGILTAILGIISRDLHPELLSEYGAIVGPKMGLPTLLINDVPAVLGGVVMASLFGAIFSTIGPIFVAIGTVFSRDIYPFIKKHNTENVHVSRIASAVFGAIIIGASLLLYDNKAGLDIIYYAYSLRAPLFIVLVAAILWKKVTSKNANITIICASVCGISWIIFKSIFPNWIVFKYITETYITIIVSVIMVVSIALIQLRTFKKNEQNLEET